MRELYKFQVVGSLVLFCTLLKAANGHMMQNPKAWLHLILVRELYRFKVVVLWEYLHAAAKVNTMKNPKLWSTLSQ